MIDLLRQPTPDPPGLMPIYYTKGARGYFVSTVGRDETLIREYIRDQEQEDKRLDQLSLWR
jgi:hypothetical protein